MSFSAGALWVHCPTPLGSGSLHSLHRVSKRPVHLPVLYQAKMQELNEFLKLVLVSAFFFISPLGREDKSLAGSSKPAYVTSIQSYHRSNKAIKQAWLASFFSCLGPFLWEAEGFPCLGCPLPGFTADSSRTVIQLPGAAAGQCHWLGAGDRRGLCSSLQVTLRGGRGECRLGSFSVGRHRHQSLSCL